VKIEGARGKRYLAVKADQFAYYNTYNVSVLTHIWLCQMCICKNFDALPQSYIIFYISQKASDKLKHYMESHCRFSSSDLLIPNWYLHCYLLVIISHVLPTNGSDHTVRLSTMRLIIVFISLSSRSGADFVKPQNILLMLRWLC